MNDTTNSTDLDELRDLYQTGLKAANDIAAVVDEIALRLHGLGAGSVEISCIRALADGISGVSDHTVGALLEMGRRLGIEEVAA